MSKTFKDKRAYLDRQDEDYKPKPRRSVKGRKKKTRKQEIEELLNDENFRLGI